MTVAKKRMVIAYQSIRGRVNKPERHEDDGGIGGTQHRHRQGPPSTNRTKQ